MSVGKLTTEKYSINFQWKIEKFQSYLEPFHVGKKILSPSFPLTAGNRDSRLSLELHFLKGSLDKKEWISASWQPSAGDERVTQWSLFILNNRREMIFIKQFDILDTNLYADTRQKFINKKQLLDSKDEFLLDDTLTVGIELYVLVDPLSIDIKYLSNPTERLIVEDLKELLKTNVASDITIFVDDKEFKAHSAILMIRSPVFFAMFSHEMKEKKDKKVSVPNVDPVIFEKTLEFIYTDQVEYLENYAEKLLEVADQYQLLKLTELCQQSLCRSLDINNVLTMMELANRFNLEQLFDRASILAATNINSIMKSTEYKKIAESNQSTKILSTLIKKLVTKVDNDAPKTISSTITCYSSEEEDDY